MTIFQLCIIFQLIAVQLACVMLWDGLEGDATYIALTPKVLRPGLPFTVSLNILKPGKNYVAEMEIRNSLNRKVASMVERNVKSGKPILLRIAEVPARMFQNDSEYEDYNVYIKGKTAEGIVMFEDQQYLMLRRKSMSIFIQTDKAVYIPGSEVKFRIIVVKRDLKPYQGSVTVKILDPKENVVKQWLDTSLNTGVYNEFLQLSKDPPLGDWKIVVKAENGELLGKTFTVEKYVLPKFDVTLELPEMSISKEDIVVTVKAIYTYGKGVEGSVRLIMCNTRNDECVEEYDDPYDDAPETIAKTKTTNKQGEATFRFKKREHNSFMLDEYKDKYKLKFFATVTEDLTGIERSANGAIIVHKYDVYIKVTPVKGALEAGLPNKYLISIKKHDGGPIDKSYQGKVKLTIDYSKENRPIGTEKQIVRLNSDGAKIVQIVPLYGSDFAEAEVHYNPSGKGTGAINTISDNVETYAKSSTDTSDYIELLSTKEVFKVGEHAKFQIISTEDKLKSVAIQMMSRGNTIMTKTISMTGKSGSIEFPTTLDMTPKSRLIIYAMPEDGKEILAHAIDFRVTGLFQNIVTLNVNKDKAEPGEKVKIGITAHSDSFVGLMAIDQSVLLLKDNNNAITTETIEKDIEKYGSTCYDYYDCQENHPHGTDASTIFEDSGMALLTDFYSRKVDHLGFVPFGALGGFEDLGGDSFDAASHDYSAASDDYYNYDNDIDQVKSPRLRTRFPETWIWMDSKTGIDGQVSFTANVPDTITSWVIDAFAVHKTAGLGVSPDSAKVQVFRPFFIRMNLPYSIKRGEKFGLQVLVFNYLSSDQSVTVTLKHKGMSGFDFVKKSGRIMKQNKGSKNYNVRTVKVSGNGGSSAVFFPIVATEIGEIKLHVKAIGSTASDAVRKTLLVEPEGFRVERNVPVLVELTRAKSFEKAVNFKFPSDAVAGSQKSQVTLTGDIMGPVLHNIKNLVKMPHGCGEQNMIEFVPNIVVMRYLKATNRLTEKIKLEALRNMEAGYQQELTFQHADNSYSCFGDDDARGSTWLTAFVVRSFKQAEPYIFIDKEKMTKSLQYLSDQQKENGEFVERGEVYQREMQGGASRGSVPMTAYVLATLLENGETNQKAVQYIEERLNNIKGESHSLALVAYALHLVESSEKGKAFQMLQSQAIDKDGMKYWSDDIKMEYSYEYSDEVEMDWSSPRPVDVETTGYALLTYVLRNQMSEALPIVQWLVKERNAYGGYSSTQDTVVALQALGAYAEKVYKKDNSIKLEIDVKNGKHKKSFTVQPKNVLALQSFDLDDTKSPIQFKAKGKGVAFAQVQYSYYMTKMQHGQAFDCDKSVVQKKDDGQVMVGICCKYKKGGKSNMAVMEVEALSGYSFDADNIDELTDIPKIQRVELEKGDTKTNVYFKSLNKRRTCVNITSKRLFDISEQKEAQVVLFDYYEPSERVEASYSARHAKSLSQACPHCWDGVLEEEESRNPRSGKCKDTKRQCKRLKPAYCSRDDGIGRWMRKRCRKVCKLCH